MKAFITIMILAGFVLVINACNSGHEKVTTAAAISKDSLVTRGKYLVTVLGCNDCHSPKKMGPQGPFADTDKLLSGYPAGEPLPAATPDQQKKGPVVFTPDLTAASGPWGISYAANITSDATGIGNWTSQQFKNALRTGKFMGLKEERMMVPPMPWQDFRNLTGADIDAVFAYLKSTKPVKNVVPGYQPPVR